MLILNATLDFYLSVHWIGPWRGAPSHYDDVTMSAIASQITSLTIVYSIVYSDADQSKHQSSASLAFVWGIHRGPVNSPHKWPVTRKMFPFDDVIMLYMPRWHIFFETDFVWPYLVGNKSAVSISSHYLMSWCTPNISCFRLWCHLCLCVCWRTIYISLDHSPINSTIIHLYWLHVA